MKKKNYKEIDRLEEWKIDIVNRPVLDEMSKVKQLNMTGETEVLFERWRNEWDEIVTAELPDVEEYLFDAEEYTDKYRFKKSKEVQQLIHNHLVETEEKIKALVAEIHDLVGSEEKNKLEIEDLKDQYRERKKNLLAYRHNFGNAEGTLEKKLDEVILKFQEFDEKTVNGDYLTARETVLVIKDLISKISELMEQIPNLLVECQTNIPSLLEDLKDGYREMEEKGYILGHIQLNKEIKSMEEELAVYLSNIEAAEIGDVQKGIDDIKENIELLFDLLEKEVHAKHFISQNEAETKETLNKAKEANNELQFEMQSVALSYHIPESEQEIQKEIEKKLSQLSKRFEILELNIQNQSIAHSLLSEDMEEIKTQLQSIVDEQASLNEKLHTLRKDELAAREKVQELTKKVSESIRLVYKSHIPGLPHDFKYLIDDSKESIQNVKLKLEEHPLDVPSVQKYLEVSVMTVDKLYNRTIDMIETVMLAEKVIQYGNRYRSSNSSVRKALEEAEAAFRGFDYHAALEQAATTIEEVEPGSLKRIEDFLANEDSSINEGTDRG